MHKVPLSGVQFKKSVCSIAFEDLIRNLRDDCVASGFNGRSHHSGRKVSIISITNRVRQLAIYHHRNSNLLSNFYTSLYWRDSMDRPLSRLSDAFGVGSIPNMAHSCIPIPPVPCIPGLFADCFLGVVVVPQFQLVQSCPHPIAGILSTVLSVVALLVFSPPFVHLLQVGCRIHHQWRGQQTKSDPFCGERWHPAAGSRNGRTS